MQWQSIGAECVSEVCAKLGLEASEELISTVVQQIDERVMQAIDLEDNGELETRSTTTVNGQKQEVQTLLLPDLVKGLNAAVDADYSNDMVFHQVAELMEQYLFGKIVASIEEQRCIELMLAGEHLQTAGGDILLVREPVPKQFEGVLHDVAASVKLAIYQPVDSNEWSLRAIPLEAGSFSFRQGFPQSWRGLLSTPAAGRGTFAEQTAFPEAVFCHAAGFYAKAGNIETAIALATAALELGEEA